MKTNTIVPILIMVCIIIACAGCTGTSGSGTQGTSSAAGSGSGGSSPAGSGSGLATGPTDTMPDNIAVVVNVGEKEYTGSIPVIFQGGQGQVNVKKIDVKLTRTDGSTQALTLGTNKGDEVNLDGTRGSGSLQGQPDRVEVWVTMNNGQTYKTVDVTREYRTR